MAPREPVHGSRRTGPPAPSDSASFVVDWQGEQSPEIPDLVIKFDAGVPEGPGQERPGAIRSPEMVNILAEVLGPPHLNVVAWVANVAYRKDVWLDIYGFDAGGTLVDRELMPLRYEAPAGGGGDLFGLHGVIAPGIAAIAYRIYYEVSGSLFTDGRLYTTDLTVD